LSVSGRGLSGCTDGDDRVLRDIDGAAVRCDCEAGTRAQVCPFSHDHCHNDRMSQWLVRRSAWQFLLIIWPFLATAGLLGIMTASWSGLGRHAHLTGALETAVPGSLVLAVGATFGRWCRARIPRVRIPRGHQESRRDMDWRKSSYSGANGGQCVEVASGNSVMIRDTADRDGVTLTFTAQAWEKFTASQR
jgi:hypothetical protein